MPMPSVERRATPRVSELEQPLQAVEQRLFDMGVALHRQDGAAIERIGAELHAALAAAVNHFGRAAQTGKVPPLLRQRLSVATGQVAAQREALARATASLDRAIDVLIPRLLPTTVYSAGGAASRATRPGNGLLA
jgi:hypothetical protein